MLTMLVVDDDQFEREGVRFLVDKYGLELGVVEADSGESALDYLGCHDDVDILLTDIRMKGMDGLELGRRVRELGRPVKVVFMSAYGEFEYAQRAIDLKAIRYLLKPVQLSDFIKVLSQVIQLCEEERQLQERRERMEKAYLKEVKYEKQKLLADLILGRTETGEERRDTVMPIKQFSGYRHMRMMMLDSRSRFFDRAAPDLEERLADTAGRRFELVHLNEFQSLLLAEAHADEQADVWTELGERLIRLFEEEYGQEMTIAVSGRVDEAKQLYEEYHAMETMLESRFFLEKGAVLLANRTLTTDEGDITAAVGEVLEEIKRHILRNRFAHAGLRFEQLFDTLQSSRRLSVVYIKYVCMEIVKAIFDGSVRKDPGLFNEQLERINGTKRLSDLRQVMRSILGEQVPAGSGEAFADGMPKAIEEVVRTVETEYRTDLSLEGLAARVFLSPSYLSYLFKKQKGISINKFITLYRMEKAKELLLKTNRKIVDIGQDVGYGNLPYFSSLFKSHYGKTPSQFREES